MSLRPSKHDDPKYLYYISNRADSLSKPQPQGNRASSLLALPSRALVPKSNDMTFFPTQRPKLTSYPSGSTSVYKEQRPKLVSRPSGSASTYSDSVRAHHGCSNPSPRTTPADRHLRDEDEDDGSIIVVKFPKPNIVSANSSDVDLSKLPTEQLVKKVSKALSMDNLRGEIVPCGQDADQGKKRCVSGTNLKGLVEVMRLESLLILLKKYLNLYHDFDESSGEIFIRSTHEEFFTNINQAIVDIAETALYLGAWSSSRTRRQTSNQQSLQIGKTLSTAYQVRETWIGFFDWKLDISDPMVRYQQREEGQVRRVTWEWRRRRQGEVVEGLLAIVADVEMDEGREGILEMQKGLRRGWREDGGVGGREAEMRGWVGGVGF